MKDTKEMMKSLYHTQREVVSCSCFSYLLQGKVTDKFRRITEGVKLLSTH